MASRWFRWRYDNFRGQVDYQTVIFKVLINLIHGQMTAIMKAIYTLGFTQYFFYLSSKYCLFRLFLRLLQKAREAPTLNVLGYCTSFFQGFIQSSVHNLIQDSVQGSVQGFFQCGPINIFSSVNFILISFSKINQ